MLDIDYIVQNLDTVKKATAQKNRTVDFDALLSLDKKRRSLQQTLDAARADRNVLAKKGRAGDAPLREKGKALKARISALADELSEVTSALHALLLTVPNVPDASVPVGKDASDNRVVSTWGSVPSFPFAVRDHFSLVTQLDLADFARGVKVGGFRTYFLKHEGALLEMALLSYCYRKLAQKGYIPLVAPSLVKEFTLIGNGQFPWGRDEVYHVEKDDVYLAGTAEVPVTAYYADEVLEERDLPKKFVAYSPCFRREAGSYGKDTKGLYRLHQFQKIEQVIIAPADTKTSLALHEELLKNSEEILQDLELAYRVMLMCTGDMGEPQVKKYDIETWMPSRKAYGETMSNSFMGDFQARRLNIRYRGKDGVVRFVHTLNNTAVASPRILIAILEHYQQEDGSVVVPTVLQDFVGCERIQRKT